MKKENPPVAAAENAFTTTTSTMNVNKSTEVQNGQIQKLTDDGIKHCCWNSKIERGRVRLIKSTFDDKQSSVRFETI